MKKSLKSDLILLSVSFIWGTTFIIVQNAIAFLPPHSFNAVRFLVATFFLLIFALIWDRKNLFAIPKELWIAGTFLGVLLFFGYGAQTVGLLYTTAANAGFITGLSVVLVPILSYFILREKLKFTSIIGVSLAAIGLYIMTMIGGMKINLGDFLIFIGAVFFALQIVFTSKYAPKYSAFILALLQIAVCGLLSLGAAIIFEDTTALTSLDVLLSFDVLIAITITALFATSIAFIIQANFQRYSSPTKTAIIFATEPVFAALTSMVVLWQLISWNVALGGLLIFLGMILAEIPPEIFNKFLPKKRRQT
jgi:drug/metabolite transporter (DMT)-like permease